MTSDEEKSLALLSQRSGFKREIWLKVKEPNLQRVF
jgi:hypothetical protein